MKPFRDARLKIKRANERVAELERMVCALLESDFYTFFIDTDPQTGDSVIKLKITRELPEQFPLVLGEAIHGFRSALDLAYVEWVRLCGVEVDRWTSLRVWESKEKLVSTLSKRKSPFSADMTEILIKKIGCYKGGNISLADLDLLDQIGKHQRIVPIIRIAKVFNIVYTARVNLQEIMSYGCSATIGQGGVTDLVYVPGPFIGDNCLELQNKGAPALQVLFPQDIKVIVSDVLFTIKNAGALARGAVRVFREHLGSRS